MSLAGAKHTCNVGASNQVVPGSNLGISISEKMLVSLRMLLQMVKPIKSTFYLLMKSASVSTNQHYLKHLRLTFVNHLFLPLKRNGRNNYITTQALVSGSKSPSSLCLNFKL